MESTNLQMNTKNQQMQIYKSKKAFFILLMLLIFCLIIISICILIYLYLPKVEIILNRINNSNVLIKNIDKTFIDLSVTDDDLTIYHSNSLVSKKMTTLGVNKNNLTYLNYFNFLNNQTACFLKQTVIAPTSQEAIKSSVQSLIYPGIKILDYDAYIGVIDFSDKESTQEHFTSFNIRYDSSSTNYYGYKFDITLTNPTILMDNCPQVFEISVDDVDSEIQIWSYIKNVDGTNKTASLANINVKAGQTTLILMIKQLTFYTNARKGILSIDAIARVCDDNIGMLKCSNR